MSVKLLTDSTTSIPKSYLDENGIALLELLIEIDGELKKEISDVNIDQFIEQIDNEEKPYTTSMSSPQHVIETFNSIIEEGYSTILYPYMTSQTSSQINAVNIAKKRINGKLDIKYYNTQLAGPAVAPFILYGNKMLKEELSIEEITTVFDRLKEQIYTLGFSENFNALFRTGKVKKNLKTQVVSNVLNIKPLFQICVGKGVEGFGGGIGFNGAVKKIKEKIINDTDKNTIYNLILTHSHAEKNLKVLENEIKNIRNIRKVKYFTIPPVIVNTVGKGAIIATLYPIYETFVKK
ncbi:MAG: DegV family protein [Candidatus Heimdallarchaeaceae archaeon]